MNTELLKDAIADAKATNLIVLSWEDGIFWGKMGWDDVEKGTVKRISCRCGVCREDILLETSSSHKCVDDISRWEPTGLLDRIGDLYDKGQVIKYLDEMIDVLRTESKNLESEYHQIEKEFEKDFLVNTLLPVVRKFYLEKTSRFPTDMKWLYDDYIAFVKGKGKLYHDLNSYLCPDGERGFIWAYVEKFSGSPYFSY
jgi:hypothetical protein